uniref:FMN-binding negative transcriptional regulator n=1 Tax=Pseudomonas fluorescens TaxID=294 RepID=UPI00130DB6A0
MLGHADRRNPQFSNGSFIAQVFFTGPNAYIPPEGYSTSQLPTWNYLSVHMKARVDVLPGEHQALQILQRSAEAFAGANSFEQIEHRSRPRFTGQEPR